MKFLKSRRQRLSTTTHNSNPEESEDPAPPPYSARYSVPPPEWRHTRQISSDLAGEARRGDGVLPEAPSTPPHCDAQPSSTASTSSQPDLETETSREPPPTLKEHFVRLKEKHNKEHSWATLRLSHYNGVAMAIPSFEPGDVVHGTIELDIQEPKFIKEISVSIRGSMSALNPSTPMLNHEEPIEFLKMTTTLWKSSLQNTHPQPYSEKSESTMSFSASHTPTSLVVRAFDPHPFPRKREDSSQSAQYPSSSGRSNLEARKLSFSLPLPEQVVLSGKHELLPPSMSDNSGQNNIVYEISALFKTGLLQFSHNLTCQIEVMPVIHPPSPSYMRQMAYNASRTPPGPLSDPSGWTISSPRTLNGRMFDAIDVSLHCTLAIANPTTYSCGGVVALQLLLVSRGSSDRDQQAFTMLSNPSCIPICLVQTLVISDSEVASGDGQSKIRSRTSNEVRIRSVVTMGTCWADRRSETATSKRLLLSEIAVPTGLTPSFSFGTLGIEYTVLLLPIISPGLVTEHTEAIVEIPVTLVRGKSRYLTFAPTGSKCAPAVDLPGGLMDQQLKSQVALRCETSFNPGVQFW